jgi:hypothetical protein
VKPLYLLALSSPAVAQTSEDYAKLSRKTWSLWSCAVLAGYTNDTPEAERLFNLGYEAGKTFVDAVRAGKVQQEDLRKHMPWLLGEKISGPNTDFSMGRMFEFIMDSTMGDIRKDSGLDADLRKTTALTMYQKQNCSFLR